MSQPTTDLMNLRNALVRKREQLDHQRDFSIVETPVLEQCIDMLNLEIEQTSASNPQRAELRSLMLTLAHTLGSSLIAAENEPESSYAAKSEELMHHIADLRKRLSIF